VATPRKLWETNVGLRPAIHIMSTFVCLAIVTKSEPVIQRDEFWQVMFQLADIRWTVGQLHTVLSQGRKPDFIDPALKALWGLPHQQDSSNPVGTHLPLNGKSCFLPV
jgi:hypothetical protein